MTTEAEVPWIDIGLPFGRDFTSDFEKWPDGECDSFAKRGLIVPGTLIEMEDGHTLLIGHINELGGTCDDCNFGGDRIVKRYKVVWTPPKPPVEPYRDPKRI